ncbi:type I-E CRISPR-associated protein Cse2/CasB [Frankia sp. Cj5]|uniref:type I-E CRISPR-associated protein Cse2/CasB n=1 Tax=Frankia sp. Cj5 TaxID=2880978 RepID=UPI001EF6F3B8|nr:type I-E CRISPR-associated protein Cse2/CasB [Frankia sp. Cj5]
MTIVETSTTGGEPAWAPAMRWYPLATRERLEAPARALVTATTRALRVPADRSALRRSLGKPPTHPMVQPAHKLVAPYLRFLPDTDERDIGPIEKIEIDAVERAFYAVAALIAAQPRTARDDHLAAAGADSDHEKHESTAEAVLASVGKPTAALPPGGGQPAPAPWRSLGRCLADAINKIPVRDREDVYRRMEARLRLVCRQDVEGVHRQLPRLIRYLRAEQVDIDWTRLIVDLARWGGNADTIAKAWLQHYYRTVRLPRAGELDTDNTDIGSTDDAESETP